MEGQLVRNVLLFGRVLRGLGLDVSPGRMTDLVLALEHVSVGKKADFYHAARCLLVRRREELPVFDEAFEAFWRKPSSGVTTLDLQALGERRRFRQPRFAPPAVGATEMVPEAAPSRAAGPGADDAPPLVQATLTWSPDERLRHKDFAELTGEEMEAVKALVAGLAFEIGRRPTRRRQPGRGAFLDLRRTLRRSLRHGGEVLHWARRERRTKPRPLVVLADISGSMERYTRLLLLFVYGLAAGARGPAEAFVFGTRLTRITRHLRGRDPDRALREIARAVPDWSGGTRIGDALREFNFAWARRVLGRGAVVLVVSDGWDCGEPDLLRDEVARLQRSAHRLLWLSPLLGSPEYEPLTRGIRAALPYVDDFLPVHNLKSLEDLAVRLRDLPARRAGRGRARADAVRDGDGEGEARHA
jgi:uncharacterized protein